MSYLTSHWKWINESKEENMKVNKQRGSNVLRHQWSGFYFSLSNRSRLLIKMSDENHKAIKMNSRLPSRKTVGSLDHNYRDSRKEQICGHRVLNEIPNTNSIFFVFPPVSGERCWVRLWTSIKPTCQIFPRFTSKWPEKKFILRL